MAENDFTQPLSVTAIVYDNESGAIRLEVEECIQEIIEAIMLERGVANGYENGVPGNPHKSWLERILCRFFRPYRQA
jgi:hypothetical protein